MDGDRDLDTCTFDLFATLVGNLGGSVDGGGKGGGGGIRSKAIRCLCSAKLVRGVKTCEDASVFGSESMDMLVGGNDSSIRLVSVDWGRKVVAAGSPGATGLGTSDGGLDLSETCEDEPVVVEPKLAASRLDMDASEYKDISSSPSPSSWS